MSSAGPIIISGKVIYVLDVTDETFDQEVLKRSATTPVVIDLWAPWCGPCKTLGPILEEAIDKTDGKVFLAKVNVDENPKVSETFQVQSIPAVFAIYESKVVDSFLGAVPKAQVEAFVNKLAPTKSEADLLAELGDEASLRKALELEGDHRGAIVALGNIFIDSARYQEALDIIAKIPDTPETIQIGAKARLGMTGLPNSEAETTLRLDTLLEKVKDDEACKQEFLDLLATLASEDPLGALYRKKLSNKLFA
ncbi:MAG: co-chaperone YbbN [Acidimicrobiales bacterium]|nr:co-chaperone YbbN [Acidimicrobiales bacterium]